MQVAEELVVDSTEAELVVDNKSEVVGSIRHDLVGCTVDSTEEELVELEVGSNRRLEDVVEDNIRRRHDLVVVGKVAEHIVPGELDRCLVCRCQFVHPLVGKDVAEQKLLKLLARMQVPT
jgi:hypothetical protein